MGKKKADVSVAAPNASVTASVSADDAAELDALRHIVKVYTGHDSVASFLKAAGHKTLADYKKATHP